MKLVSYQDQKHLTLVPSTHKNGMDVKLEDTVLFSIVPVGFGDKVRVILPIDSTVDVIKMQEKQQIPTSVPEL